MTTKSWSARVACGIFLTAAIVVISGLSGSQAMAADDPADAYPDANPLAGNEEAIEAGLGLYFKWCAACHGAQANGESRFGKYAADLRKFWRGYPEYMIVVLNGRTKKQMPPWGGVLTEEEINQIGAYLETLAIEGARWTR